MDSPESREGGPKTWVVLALTAAAATLVAAVFVGWRMWRGDDVDDAAPATSVPEPAAPETTDGGEPAGAGEMVRRTTEAGIELRIQLVGFNGAAEVLVARGVDVEEAAWSTMANEPDAEESGGRAR